MSKPYRLFWNKLYEVWSSMEAAGMLFTLAAGLTGLFSNEDFSSSSWNFCLAFNSLMNTLNCLLTVVLLLHTISPKTCSQFMCYLSGKLLAQNNHAEKCLKRRKLWMRAQESCESRHSTVREQRSVLCMCVLFLIQEQNLHSDFLLKLNSLKNWLSSHFNWISTWRVIRSLSDLQRHLFYCY